MGALSKMAAKMTRFSNWGFLVKKKQQKNLAVLASAIGTIHFVQEQKIKTKNI